LFHVRVAQGCPEELNPGEKITKITSRTKYYILIEEAHASFEEVVFTSKWFL
jgi:hypothetical protein